jgi:hypothetical protein
MITEELRDYNGEASYPQFYLYISAVGAWLNTFRVPRKHDSMPVIYSTPQRPYFLNQLAKYGFDTSNGQIPTPIWSYRISGYERRKDREIPRVVKYFNKETNKFYPDLIPFNITWTISLWTRKEADTMDIMYQFQTAFEQGMKWIIFTDEEFPKRTQTTVFFLDSIADSTNPEPGEKGDMEYKTDITLKSECYLPRTGFDGSFVKKIYIDLGTSEDTDNCTIEYISGSGEVYVSGVPQLGVKKINTGELCGIISPNLIAFSGTVNVGEPDEQLVVEHYTW